MTQLHQLSLVLDSQKEVVCQMLARAFHQDPMMTYIIPEAQKRPRSLALFLRFA